MQIEVLKLGYIIPKVVGGNIDREKETIMIVYNGGPIFDHYVSILKEKCSDEYKFLKTDKNIIGGPLRYIPGNIDNRLFGELDDNLVVGMSFAVGSWHSSIVQRIINKNIAITNNSVYAIHNISEFRNKKIQDLGL